MLSYRKSWPPATLAEHSSSSVYVAEVTDKAAARHLIDTVIAMVDHHHLPQVHVWAEADALPLLAAAAAEVKDLPEGFQLRQIPDTPVDIVEGSLRAATRPGEAAGPRRISRLVPAEEALRDAATS